MIDAVASEVHFLDHLAPIWAALPDRLRGRFHVHPDLAHHALDLTVVDVTLEPPRPSPWPLLTASFGDLHDGTRMGRRIIYLEHGSGQSYSNRHSSYCGGRGRENVELFLCPNHEAAHRNRRYYPKAKVAVIGCPKLDEIPAPPDGTVVAISFHWRCNVALESNTALDHYARALPSVAEDLARRGLTLIGHGHPRIWREVEPIYRAAGIDPVEHFADVCRVASVYAVDNSSTLFEFAALDRPVVVLNSPRYRRSVRHGLRFWDVADVGIQVDHPADLAEAFAAALADPPHLAESRRRAMTRVYPCRDATPRAVEAIEALMNEPSCPVCGTPSATCTGHDEGQVIQPLDMVESRDESGPLLEYVNPEWPSAKLRLRQSEGERMGLTLWADREKPAPAKKADADTSERVAFDGSPVPDGSLPPGGPTARARAAKAAAGAPDAPDREGGDPSHKKREAPAAPPAPAPNGTRRRRRPEAATR